VQDQGRARLPVPSSGDIFLDLEGDPFARDGGREYLFGLVVLAADGCSTNRSHWAFSDTEERIAFEATIDEILQSWESNPEMHIYHYAPYEPAALKRLMGRHATREAEIDRMIRAELLVDLYAVAKHSVRVSVERYSISKAHRRLQRRTKPLRKVAALAERLCGWSPDRYPDRDSRPVRRLYPQRVRSPVRRDHFENRSQL